MRRLATMLLGVTILAAGCGGGSARNDVAKTADRVGTIRSGTIAFSLLVTPRTKLAKHPFGFRLHGPFRFGEKPTAHVDYTQIANGKNATATLVLERDGGYAVVAGKRRALTSAQLGELRGAAAAARDGARIDVSDWIESARGCGERCVEGTLDVAQAVNRMLSLSGSRRTVSDAERKELEDATKHAGYRLTYTPEHLVRDLKIDVDLGFDAPAGLRSALGDLVGAKLALRLSVANPRT